MALDRIVKRIKDEASGEAETIIDEANRKARTIKDEMDKEIRKELQERNKILQRDLANTRNIYISDGKRKARQAVLCSKEEMIWDAICEIRKALNELGEEKLARHLKGLVEEAKSTLGKDMMIYPVREIDSKVIEGSGTIGPLLEKALGTESRLKRFKGVDPLGGFIAVSNSGDKVLDMTYRGIMDRKEEVLREIIARNLFMEE